MCSIWNEKKEHKLTLNQIKDLFESNLISYPLDSISLTGGEIFIHPKIKQIYDYLSSLKSKGKIKEIVINSNGYATKAITNFFHNINDTDGLDLYFSMDGTKELHDLQRGISGAYNALVDTIKKLRDKKINLKVKMTITEYNYKDITKVYDFCRKNNLVFYVKLAENQAKNYYQRSKQNDNFVVNKKYNRKILKDLKNILKKELVREDRIIKAEYFQLLIESLIKQKTISSCLTPKHYLFVSSDGNVYPCLYEKSIANITKKDWKDDLDMDFYNKLIEDASSGKCKQCMAYHGFMKTWNLAKKDIFLDLSS